MDEYISREAVIDCIDRAYDYDYDLGDSRHNDMFKDMIEAIPAEDVQPVVHGRWKYLRPFWYCSNCNTDCDEWGCRPPWRFCPQCGARMDVEDT